MVDTFDLWKMVILYHKNHINQYLKLYVFRFSEVGSSIPRKLVNSVFFPFLVKSTTITITVIEMTNIAIPAIEPAERELVSF